MKRALMLILMLLAGTFAFAQETPPPQETPPSGETTAADSEQQKQKESAEETQVVPESSQEQERTGPETQTGATAEPQQGGEIESDSEMGPAETGPTDFSIEAGFQPVVHLDTNSSQFEEFRDVPQGFVIPFLRISGGTENRFSIIGQDIEQADQRYAITLDRNAFSLGLFYDQIPHRFGNDARSPLNRVSRDTWAVSDITQQEYQRRLEAQFAANRNAINFNFLSALAQPTIDAAQPFDLELLRERSLVEAGYAPGPYSLRFTYFQENRDGTRPAGTSFGFSNVVETGEPIEYTTRDLGINGEMPFRNGLIRAALHYNDFSNAIDAEIFDNPWRFNDSTDPNAYQAPGTGSVNGPTRGRLDLAPDNQAVFGSIGGLVKLPGNSRLNADVTIGRWEQNDRLLPHTTNTAINAPALPVARFDGELGTVAGNVAFVSRPIENLTLTARYRHYDLENESPRIRFEQGYVRFDAALNANPRITVPYGFTNNRFELTAGYDIGSQVGVEVGYRQDAWERTFRETEETTEGVIRFAADYRPLDWLGMRGTFETGDRDFDGHYEGDEAEHASFLNPGPATNLPSLRRYDQAERDVNRISFMANVTPFGAFALNFNYLQNEEEYTASSHGLIEADVQSWTAEVDYSPSDRWSAYAFYTLENWSNFQRGRQSGATPSADPADDWTSDVDDDVNTFGLGGNVTFIPERLEMKLFGRYQSINGFNDFSSPPGGTNLSREPQDIARYDDQTVWSLSAEAQYRLSGPWFLSAGGWIEGYEVDDAFTDNTRNYMPGGWFLDPNDRDYDAFVLYIRAAYRR
jgi:MtrB/PioB family decaheme-associated outer membrane protein